MSQPVHGAGGLYWTAWLYTLVGSFLAAIWFSPWFVVITAWMLVRPVRSVLSI